VAESAGPDAVSRLWWALRRYVSVVVAGTLLTVLVAVTLSPPPPPEQYHASALVVARELVSVRAEQLPRLAEAIFAGNNVGQRTVREVDLPIRAEELVPTYANVEVVEGTVVIRVIGMAEDRRLASTIANESAEALVSELDRLGAGVGTFALQERAPVPLDPAPQEVRIPPTLIGVVAGLILGTGLAFLLLVLRRPVIDVDEAVAVVDEPLVGVLELSRSGHFDAVENVPGGVALVDAIYPRRREIQVVVGANDPMVRSQASVILAQVLATVGPVVVVTSRDAASRRASRFLRGQPNVRLLQDHQDAPPVDERDRPIPVVADGRPSVRFALPSTVQPILVVREGIPLHQLRKAARHLQPQQAQGILWVANRGGPGIGLLRRLLGRRVKPRPGRHASPSAAKAARLASHGRGERHHEWATVRHTEQPADPRADESRDGDAPRVTGGVGSPGEGQGSGTPRR
jgi:hypothetical protein